MKFAAIFLLIIPHFALAFIPPTKIILQKTAENSGSGVYSIEQEVQFTVGEETLSFKESWLIENDRNMRLTVTGGKDLQNKFKLQYVYNGGQRWSLQNGAAKSEKISDEFLEKFFNFRNPEILATTLLQNNILPNEALKPKAFPKSSTEIKNDSEAWVRYSRVGGTVSYAFGMPSISDQDKGKPGLWIEQDHFHLRKLRLPSLAEMLASNYGQYSKGLNYPKQRVIRWGNNTVSVRLISAVSRPQTSPTLFQSSSLDSSANWESLNKISGKEIVMEFYSRFR